MNKLGIMGGIGPESTIAYYRSIIAAGRERGLMGEFPPVLINSIDLQRVLQLVADNGAHDPDGLPRKRGGGTREGWSSIGTSRGQHAARRLQRSPRTLADSAGE